MKEKREVYKQHAILEDIDGEDGRIHMNLAKLDLDITKDVDVSYFLPNKEGGHKDEKISLKEFKDRMINNQEFRENVFVVIVDGEDYEIRLSGGEMWVCSFDKNITTVVFNLLIEKSDNSSFEEIYVLEGSQYKGEYFGNIKDGMRHGVGSFKYPGYFNKIGIWKDDKIHGYGIYRYNSDLLLESQSDWGWYSFMYRDFSFFEDDCISNKYYGEFKDDKANGEGTLYISQNGEESNILKYTGCFQNNYFHGYGHLLSGDTEYVGEFKDSQYHGEGTLTRTDPDGIYENIKYEGGWVDGLKKGAGVEYINNEIYVGEFDFYLISGAIIFSDESIYLGDLEFGKANGEGSLHFPDGTILEGKFESNKLKESTHKYDRVIKIDPNGIREEGYWLDAKFHILCPFPDISPLNHLNK